MKRPLYDNGSGKHDASANIKDSNFQRLAEERANELGDLQWPVPPSKAITVTTNIETSQKMPSFGQANNMLGARHSEW